MAIPTAAIIPGETAFNVAESYYSMFPYEMSESKFQSLEIAQINRVPKLTFEKLLDVMIEKLKMKFIRKDTFLVVCHGLNNSMDYALGLTMPLTDNSTMKTVEEVLRELLNFMNKGASEAQMTNYEKNPGFKINNVTPKLPKGSISRIVTKMKILRDLKCRRVEFRACNLGTNPGLMDTLGQCFSTRFIYAPKVHMFYVRCNPGRPVKDPVLDLHLKSRSSARLFHNGSGRLAVQMTGSGVARTTWTETTATDLGFFVDKYIWDKNSYPRGTSNPSAFLMAGMDVGGSKRYALPQEPDYASSLVWRGPLPGNMI